MLFPRKKDTFPAKNVNFLFMVLEAGLEPAWSYPNDFESFASTIPPFEDAFQIICQNSQKEKWKTLSLIFAFFYEKFGL